MTAPLHHYRVSDDSGYVQRNLHITAAEAVDLFYQLPDGWAIDPVCCACAAQNEGAT